MDGLEKDFQKSLFQDNFKMVAVTDLRILKAVVFGIQWSDFIFYLVIIIITVITVIIVITILIILVCINIKQQYYLL